MRGGLDPAETQISRRASEHQRIHLGIKGIAEMNKNELVAKAGYLSQSLHPQEGNTRNVAI